MVNPVVSGYILIMESPPGGTDIRTIAIIQFKLHGDIIMSGLLGEILVESGEITMEQLNEALEFQKENGGLLGEILVGLGYIQDEELKKHLKDQWKYKAGAGAITPE